MTRQVTKSMCFLLILRASVGDRWMLDRPISRHPPVKALRSFIIATSNLIRSYSVYMPQPRCNSRSTTESQVISQSMDTSDSSFVTGERQRFSRRLALNPAQVLAPGSRGRSHHSSFLLKMSGKSIELVTWRVIENQEGSSLLTSGPSIFI